MGPEPQSGADSRRGLAVGAIFGLPIGVLSGFTGVGGGEYRVPVLLALMGKVRWAIAANLLIGTIVSVFNVILRGGWTLAAQYLVLTLLFISTSLPGAYVGAAATTFTSTKTLKVLLAGILVATGLRLILVPLPEGGAPVFDVPTVLLALGVGFALGVVSGLLGVAGGEYRIPVLILLFGVPTIVAGTVSSLTAIPQQVVGFLKHRGLKHTGPMTYRLGAVMGAASIAGVAIGIAFIGRTTEAIVAQVLGAAMIAAAGWILWDSRHPEVEDEPSERAAAARETATGPGIVDPPESGPR